MSTPSKKRYTEEYKINVVRMIEERNRAVSEISKDMDISVFTLYGWIKKYGSKKTNGFDSCGSKEINQLKHRLAEVEEERDILKKAMAIFTQRPR